MSDGSVTIWIKELRTGNNDVAQKLWERYLDRLINLAADRLRNSPKRKADEEDLVLCAFEEFRTKASRGRYPKLNDREDLWQVLVQVVEMRAIDHFRREVAYQKRVATESDLQSPDASDSVAAPIQRISDREPTPAEAASFADALVMLLARLETDELRCIARMRLAGMSDSEVAQKLQRSLRTVERRLKYIREKWADLLDPSR